MVSLKDNRPYYGSATSKIFQEDFKKYKLTVEVLEEVKNRDNLLIKELSKMDLNNLKSIMSQINIKTEDVCEENSETKIARKKINDLK